MKHYYNKKIYAVVSICTYNDNACIESYFQSKSLAKKFINKYFNPKDKDINTYVTIIKTNYIYPIRNVNNFEEYRVQIFSNGIRLQTLRFNDIEKALKTAIIYQNTYHFDVKVIYEKYIINIEEL